MYQRFFFIFIGLAFLAVGHIDAQRTSIPIKSPYKIKDVKLDENYLNITTRISRPEAEQRPSLASVKESIAMDIMRRMNDSYRAYKLFPASYSAFQYPSNSTGYKGLVVNKAYSVGFSLDNPPSNATYVTTTTPAPENATTTEAPTTTTSMPFGAQQFPNSQRNMTQQENSQQNSEQQGNSNQQGRQGSQQGQSGQQVGNRKEEGQVGSQQSQGGIRNQQNQQSSQQNQNRNLQGQPRSQTSQGVNRNLQSSQQNQGGNRNQQNFQQTFLSNQQGPFNSNQQGFQQRRVTQQSSFHNNQQGRFNQNNSVNRSQSPLNNQQGSFIQQRPQPGRVNTVKHYNQQGIINSHPQAQNQRPPVQIQRPINKVQVPYVPITTQQTFNHQQLQHHKFLNSPQQNKITTKNIYQNTQKPSVNTQFINSQKNYGTYHPSIVTSAKPPQHGLYSAPSPPVRTLNLFPKIPTTTGHSPNIVYHSTTYHNPSIQVTTISTPVAHTYFEHPTVISYSHARKLQSVPEGNYKDASGYHYGRGRGVAFEEGRF